MDELTRAKLEPYKQYLRPIAKRVETDFPHFITGADEGFTETYLTQGDVFCSKCIFVVLERLKVEAGERANELDWGGGYDLTDDNPQSCEECGKYLIVCPTSTYAEQEIEHYQMYGEPSDFSHDSTALLLLYLIDACEDEHIPALLGVLAKMIPSVPVLEAQA